MQVSIEEPSQIQRKMTVAVPMEVVNSKVQSKLNETAKTVKLNGFRPGKVPLKVVEKRFGDAIRGEVVREVISDGYQKALNENALQPAGYPQIETTKSEEDTDLEFVATFEIYPEVELADISDVSLNKAIVEITDEDVSNKLAQLQQERATWSIVERAAKSSDKVKIDFVGTIDGEAFEGGSAEGVELELGSGQMIPGFEDQLEGSKAGDEKTLDVSFPEDYFKAELAGKPAQFATKVIEVQEKTLPEINDELAKSYEEENLDAMRKSIEGHLAKEIEDEVKADIKGQLMATLIERHEFEVPESLITQEIRSLKQEALQQMGLQKMPDLDLLPSEGFKDKALERVKLGLIMKSVVKAHSLDVDGREVNETIQRMAAGYPNSEEVVNLYYENEQLLNSVETMVLENQVVDKLVESAAIVEEHKKYSEYMEGRKEASQSK